MLLKNLVEWGKQHPKQLFLIDGVGALVSAIMWGVVFVQFETITGFPANTCYFLAVFPVFFMVFDFASYLWAKKLNLNLRYIAMQNAGYVLISLLAMVKHAETITLFGFGYLFMEIVIVLFLVRVEWKVSHLVKTKL